MLSVIDSITDAYKISFFWTKEKNATWFILAIFTLFCLLSSVFKASPDQTHCFLEPQIWLW